MPPPTGARAPRRAASAWRSARPTSVSSDARAKSPAVRGAAEAGMAAARRDVASALGQGRATFGRAKSIPPPRSLPSERRPRRLALAPGCVAIRIRRDPPPERPPDLQAPRRHTSRAAIVSWVSYTLAEKSARSARSGGCAPVPLPPRPGQPHPSLTRMTKVRSWSDVAWPSMTVSPSTRSTKPFPSPGAWWGRDPPLGGAPAEREEHGDAARRDPPSRCLPPWPPLKEGAGEPGAVEDRGLKLGRSFSTSQSSLPRRAPPGRGGR